MVNTQIMTRKQRKISTSDNDDPKSWSNLPHDLLIVIMMHLGLFDFISLSGVCKSWRSAALSNWNKFMVSKQPMSLSVSTRVNKKDLYLEDYTSRKLKTMIPHSSGRIFIGLTCGYLIFHGWNTHDFWLVNPFTRKELHFPRFTFGLSTIPTHASAILVFSPSMSGWVLVVLPYKLSHHIFFSLAGKEAKWSYISCDSPMRDIHFFKGKIYTLNCANHLYELRLGPPPALTLHKMKNHPFANFRYMKLVSSGEHLYAIYVLDWGLDAYEADFNEMKWVSSERILGEYAVFASLYKCHAVIKPDTWAHPWTRYQGFNLPWRKKRGRCSTEDMWYFPHQCLKDNDSGALQNRLED